MGIRPIEDISSLSHINDNKIDNIAVYTGDTYANWLLENSLETTLQGTKITYSLRDVTTSTNTNQPGTPVEYGGTAVCSSGWRISLGIVGRMLQLLQKRWPKGILVCYSYREATEATCPSLSITPTSQPPGMSTQVINKLEYPTIPYYGFQVHTAGGYEPSHATLDKA